MDSSTYQQRVLGRKEDTKEGRREGGMEGRRKESKKKIDYLETSFS